MRAALTATTLTVRSNCGKSSFKTPGFHVVKKNASNDGDPREGWMSRALFLGTLLVAGPFLGMSCAQNSWAQNKTEPTRTAPPFPFTKTIFQWDYSCPAGIGCSVACPGGEVSHVIKLSLYLGTVLFDSGQNAPAVFYEMNTREYPHASGFSISPGLTTLSCQVNGMTLDYSGPPK
jgi:hypothetical protein